MLSPSARQIAGLGQTTLATRTSIVTSLLWVLGLLVLGATACAYGAPSWLQVGLFALLALIVLLFAVVFAILAFKNPDTLRSERFVLSKFAMQLIGDSEAGLFKPGELQTLLGAGEVASSEESDDDE